MWRGLPARDGQDGMNPLIAAAFGVLLLGGLCFVFLPDVIDRVLQPAQSSTGARLKLAAGMLLLAVLIAEASGAHSTRSSLV